MLPLGGFVSARDERATPAFSPWTSVDGNLTLDVPALYERQWEPMTRLASLLLGSNAQAEEIVQEAFITLYKRQDAIRHPGAAVAYVRQTIVNMCRSAMRHERVVDRTIRNTTLLDVPSAEVDALISVRAAECIAVLRTLPTRQREVLVLRYWAGLREAEIAQTLGISAGTVKSNASRGMARLRAELKVPDDE